jgi:hypothetical protein
VVGVGVRNETKRTTESQKFDIREIWASKFSDEGNEKRVCPNPQGIRFIISSALRE